MTSQMPKIELKDQKNKKVGTVDVSSDVFDVTIKEHLVQQYVTLQLASRRSGTASTKSNKGTSTGAEKNPGVKREPDGHVRGIPVLLSGEAG